MIKAIIFDLDNTLIDRQKAFSEMLRQTIPQILPNETAERVEAMVQDILVFDHNGAVERIDAFGKWIEKYDIKEITAAEFSSFWSKESGKVCYLFDDVRETLAFLKGKYKLAVLSNGSVKSQRRKMDTIDIYEYLDYSLISDEVNTRKPDPWLYQYTCEQLGLKPEECLYVGDSYKIDIEGSRNAGLHALYVDRKNEVHEDADTIYQIHEIIDYLKKFD